MKHSLTFLLLLMAVVVKANFVLIPMDNEQTDHLKAYGIAYKVLKDDQDVEWLLNYRGGSFMMKQTTSVETECRVRGVSFETISDSKAASIRQQLSRPRSEYERGDASESGQKLLCIHLLKWALPSLKIQMPFYWCLPTPRFLMNWCMTKKS